MTARPAFGDFLTAARDHASVAAARHQTDREGENVQEVTDSLLHVITVMDRYLQDIAAVPGDMRSRAAPPLTAWGRARLTARDALTHAARHLRQHTRGTRAPGVTARSELARRLDAAAVALTAGRDLLNTHLARDPRGARQFRSEWGLIALFPAGRAGAAWLNWPGSPARSRPPAPTWPCPPGPWTPQTRRAACAAPAGGCRCSAPACRPRSGPSR